MRCTTKSLVLTSILGASIASPLTAQTFVRFGTVAPTTVLTTAQRIFAEAYVDAVTGMDIERYKYLLHPKTLACMSSDNAAYFKLIFVIASGGMRHPAWWEKLREVAVIDAIIRAVGATPSRDPRSTHLV